MESKDNFPLLDLVEPGTDLSKVKYSKRGDPIYADGRQVMVRTCHDALVGYDAGEGEGILLIRRKAEPAYGYLWPLGGGIERGVPMNLSLARKVRAESGLEISDPVLLNTARMVWNTTPHKTAEEQGLPLGIDDFGLLFFARGTGEITLDKLHEMPTIVTPEMYNEELRNSLHPYVKVGMDLAIPLLRQ
jgi:hypothetical protein